MNIDKEMNLIKKECALDQYLRLIDLGELQDTPLIGKLSPLQDIKRGQSV